MSSQANLPIELPAALIELPADKLLEQFGAGKPSPGSGSAAALMGILAAQLVTTVCKIAIASNQRSGEMSFILENVEGRTIPRLKDLFQRDADIFENVVALRLQRDQETEPVAKRRLRDQALRQLREATDIIITVTRVCIQLVDYALLTFDAGPKKVRGDSGAAISAAVAGAMSGVFIINLNLRSFQAGEWAQRVRAVCDNLHAEILQKQEDAFARIVTLRPEEFEAGQYSLL